MPLPFLLHLLQIIILLHSSLPSTSSSSSPTNGLGIGSSLSVEKIGDVLASPNRLFTAGFYSVGQNAYCFAIWFTKSQSSNDNYNLTIVWMANRDVPVNGKLSKLSLLKTGNLVLRDADQELPIWTTSTRDSSGSARLQLHDSGNLCLQKPDGQVLWQSFGSPTDTLLPGQNITKATSLISSRSLTDHSSGYYKLFFDNDNVLRLVYDSPKITSVYWPNPELRAWDNGRNTYNSERSGAMDSSGYFLSSDRVEFYTTDSGKRRVQRRMTLDIDGNIRVYSLVDESRGIWRVTWQAISQPCTIHGICGENSTCTYDERYGRKCSCLPKHKMINQTDWSYGCAPEFEPTLCANGDDSFLHLPHVDFYGYDSKYLPNYTFDACKQECANICNCKGFQYKYDQTKGYYLCYPKFLLVNGYRAVSFSGSMYIKLPTTILSPSKNEEYSLSCSVQPPILHLDRVYDKYQESGSLKHLLVFAYALGGLEVLCILFFFYRTRNTSAKVSQGYLQAATGFRRFSHAELKKASKNFSTELGRGSGGVVYKGVLSDNRIAAIKRLNEASSRQGVAEFLAEVSLIGRLNHMNLIEIWGYCVEGKHRLLVYEYMEHGSLAENLHANTLNWENMFEIAVGTAKGLAYLHEECLEWILHCDVKPHNILLDASYNPKVADFGLSKFLDRNGSDDSGFTKARGTRGYMAPEWLFVNLPITSKVDVYSYGVLMLEMITGRGPTGSPSGENDDGAEGGLVRWVREKIHAGDHGNGNNTMIKDILDSKVKGDFNAIRMEILIKVALKCVEEDKDARPTMSQVVDMLLNLDGDY